MSELNTFAIRQGDSWEYRYAVSSLLRIFISMPSRARDHYCESQSLSPLANYVEGRPGSSARQDLRKMIRLITDHSVTGNDERNMEKAIEVLGRWYKARPRIGWQNFVNGLALSLMEHARGQTFYVDMQEELMDNYITGWNFKGEDKGAVCTRLFADHCPSASGSGEPSTEATQ